MTALFPAGEEPFTVFIMTADIVICFDISEREIFPVKIFHRFPVIKSCKSTFLFYPVPAIKAAT
jgi:hypothetical protein